MTFSKKVMTTTELMKENGFTRTYLMRMAHIKGQKYARKLPGGNKFYWDTEKLGRAIERLPEW